MRRLISGQGRFAFYLISPLAALALLAIALTWWSVRTLTVDTVVASQVHSGDALRIEWLSDIANELHRVQARLDERMRAAGTADASDEAMRRAHAEHLGWLAVARQRLDTLAIEPTHAEEMLAMREFFGTYDRQSTAASALVASDLLAASQAAYSASQTLVSLGARMHSMVKVFALESAEDYRQDAAEARSGARQLAIVATLVLVLLALFSLAVLLRVTRRMALVSRTIVELSANEDAAPPPLADEIELMAARQDGFLGDLARAVVHYHEALKARHHRRAAQRGTPAAGWSRAPAGDME